jgi:hypothetical protein
MTKRIDQLTPGTQVVLGFVGWGNTLTTDEATFVGVTGAGDARRATFRSANAYSPPGKLRVGRLPLQRRLGIRQLGPAAAAARSPELSAMRVRVAFTVDVAPDAWADEYGVERSEVRADVIRYVENSVRAHLDALGLTAVTRSESRKG